jgi:hypothetical protein
VSKPLLLAPLLGALLALWRADGVRAGSPPPPTAATVVLALPPTKVQRCSALVLAAEAAAAAGGSSKVADGGDKAGKAAAGGGADEGEDEEEEEDDGPLPHTSFIEALADVADERVQVRHARYREARQVSRGRMVLVDLLD